MSVNLISHVILHVDAESRSIGCTVIWQAAQLTQ